LFAHIRYFRGGKRDGEEKEGGINAPSRLAQTLGLNARVQSFQAFNTCYKDTGLVGVYFVCEESGVMPVVDAITQQWIDLCDNITDEEVERGKRTLLTNILLMLDGSTPICEDIGRWVVCSISTDLCSLLPCASLFYGLFEKRINICDAYPLIDVADQCLLTEPKA
uniref:Peptidase M16 C-terminal domain-containing protein n=1 Tax=Parascaris equorum TaxID=6256 RepID=A0A914RYZ4_PAREQ